MRTLFYNPIVLLVIVLRGARHCTCHGGLTLFCDSVKAGHFDSLMPREALRFVRSNVETVALKGSSLVA